MGIFNFVFNTANAGEHSIYQTIALNHPFDAFFSVLGEIGLFLGILLLIPEFYKRIMRGQGERRILPNSLSLYHNFFITGTVFVILGGILILLAGYLRSDAARIPLSFSPRVMSEALWVAYKKTYIEQETGRTFDPSRGNITTSEAESYTMFRAVLVDDKETFDRSWKWTEKNLSRAGDSLFSWKFGERNDGTYGVLEDGGINTASDADTDIALSLVFAYARWHDPLYMKSAEKIIHDIGEIEVVTIVGKPYLAANNMERNSDKDFVILNPSYFSPYAYRIFAKIDSSHPWMDLVDTSYEVISQSLSLPLDNKESAKIIPDWLAINTTTGNISAAPSPELTTNYGFDAMRLPWRLAIDWKWNKEPRARAVLSQNKFFSEYWKSNKNINGGYKHNGALVGDYEAPAFYGGTLGYFVVTNSPLAETIYKDKLLILFDPDNNTWRETLSYYDDNWVWFGMALYNDKIPNLAKNLSFLTP